MFFTMVSVSGCPRVLVGCPTYEGKAYCLDAYMEGIARLSYGNSDLVVVDNSPTGEYVARVDRVMKRFGRKNFFVVKDSFVEGVKDRIVQSRNVLRAMVLERGYEWLLSLEQDLVPPPDVVERLLSHGREVVTGVYFKEYTLLNKETNLPEEVALPVVYNASPDGESLVYVQPEELDSGRLVRVAACGLGCVLVHRSVLERVKFRHNPKYPAFDDMYFCKDCEQLGIPVFADMSVRCVHLHKGTDWTRVR